MHSSFLCSRNHPKYMTICNITLKILLVLHEHFLFLLHPVMQCFLSSTRHAQLLEKNCRRWPDDVSIILKQCSVPVWCYAGAGDRLGLKCDVTGKSVPTAMLPYCGRTLLEGLVRDLQVENHSCSFQTSLYFYFVWQLHPIEHVKMI